MKVYSLLVFALRIIKGTDSAGVNKDPDDIQAFLDDPTLFQTIPVEFYNSLNRDEARQLVEAFNREGKIEELYRNLNGEAIAQLTNDDACFELAFNGLQYMDDKSTISDPCKERLVSMLGTTSKKLPYPDVINAIPAEWIQPFLNKEIMGEIYVNGNGVLDLMSNEVIYKILEFIENNAEVEIYGWIFRNRKNFNASFFAQVFAKFPRASGAILNSSMYLSPYVVDLLRDVKKDDFMNMSFKDKTGWDAMMEMKDWEEETIKNMGMDLEDLESDHPVLGLTGEHVREMNTDHCIMLSKYWLGLFQDVSQMQNDCIEGLLNSLKQEDPNKRMSDDAIRGIPDEWFEEGGPYIDRAMAAVEANEYYAFSRLGRAGLRGYLSTVDLNEELPRCIYDLMKADLFNELLKVSPIIAQKYLEEAYELEDDIFSRISWETLPSLAFDDKTGLAVLGELQVVNLDALVRNLGSKVQSYEHPLIDNLTVEVMNALPVNVCVLFAKYGLHYLDNKINLKEECVRPFIKLLGNVKAKDRPLISSIRAIPVEYFDNYPVEFIDAINNGNYTAFAHVHKDIQDAFFKYLNDEPLPASMLAKQLSSSYIANRALKYPRFIGKYLVNATCTIPNDILSELNQNMFNKLVDDDGNTGADLLQKLSTRVNYSEILKNLDTNLIKQSNPKTPTPIPTAPTLTHPPQRNFKPNGSGNVKKTDSNAQAVKDAKKSEEASTNKDAANNEGNNQTKPAGPGPQDGEGVTTKTKAIIFVTSAVVLVIIAGSLGYYLMS